MKPFLNILVGIDETEGSRHALITARAIAAKEGAKVTACHIIPLPELNEFIEYYQSDDNEVITEARDRLRDFTNEVLGPDHGVVCRVAEGSPHHELAAIANEENHDLLVVGHGEEDGDPGNFGRFGIRCLRFAKMPVLIVNQEPALPALPVAACLDFSNSTGPILENIARISPDPAPGLHLIHACRPPWLQKHLPFLGRPFPGDSGEKSRFREVIDGQLSVICKQAATITGTTPEMTRLEDRHPNRALLDHLSSTSYGLVVIGRSGSGFKGLLTDVLGGTAESLIRHAQCPVLIVPVITD